MVVVVGGVRELARATTGDKLYRKVSRPASKADRSVVVLQPVVIVVLRVVVHWTDALSAR